MLVKCHCGCSYLEIDRDEELDFSYIMYYKYNFYSSVSIFERIKKAWLTLIGKDYLLFDIVVENEKIEEAMRRFLKENPQELKHNG